MAAVFCGVSARPVHAADDAVALRAFAKAQRAAPSAARLPRAAFLLESTTTSVALSPDGSQLAWLHQNGRSREVWSRPLAGNGAPRRLLGNTSARDIAWTRDSRWLLLQSPREMFALAARGQSGSGIVVTLGGQAGRQVIAVDGSQDAAVLAIEQSGMTAQGTPGAWSLQRIDVQGRRTPLWRDRQRIIDAATDAQGRLLWLQLVDGAAQVLYRFENGRPRAVLRCENLHRCGLLTAMPDGGAWLRGDIDGDLTRLQALSPDGHPRDVQGDPREVADVDEVIFDPATNRPRFIAYRSAVPVLQALDAADAAPLAALKAKLPGRDLDLQVAPGTWLVEERGSTLQGRRWHLFDPRTRTLAFLFEDAPTFARDGKPATHVPAAAVANVLPMSWRASDGMHLHGFLTLPPGRDAATLPLVVNVHGGPWNHWRPEFRAVTQMLANRGYAVFEPDPRSSTGYGRAYVMGAGSDFGNGRVQQDIVEGTRWLLANGIGDANRVGITGASFGGYSTLLGVTFQPELFKVGAAMVPPPDFGWVLRWILRNPEALQLGNVVPMRDWARMMGVDPADATTMARLHAQSPLANATRMRRPLLIAAGGEDQRVGIAGVIEYAARLKLAGSDASLLVDADAGHSNREPIAREAWLFELEHIFHAHLGGAAPQPPDGEIRAYLRKGLRMAGRDFSRFSAAPAR
ncbi:MAG: S9 family peptidase [Xanthomonadales bacterium]|nr:S9 family peptidase [Xanthomonadales bacterium]